MKKQFIIEAKRMQQLAGIPISEMSLPEMARTAKSEVTVDQVVKLFNDLSLSAEGDEEKGTFDSKLDDKLQDLGLKFKFKGSDYINKKDLIHLGKDELQTLMQMLSKLKYLTESQLNEAIKSIDFKTLKKIDGDEIKATDLKVGETRVAGNMSYGSNEELQQQTGVVSKIAGDKVTFDLPNGTQKAMALADLLLVTNF